MTERISYPELGENQRHVLCLLRSRGEWNASTRWRFGSVSETTRIMTSLVKQGFVAEAPGPEYNGKRVNTYIAI